MVKNIVKVSNDSTQAKYRQIINSINDAIRSGKLKRGDKVPSINEIANEFKLSRDTVLLAFNELKAKGVLIAAPGKGCYIDSTEIDFKHRIFLLFDEFNAFKEDLFNAFVENLEGQDQVDIYFHHFNYRVFENLIRNNLNKYTSFVIMPANLKETGPVIAQIPRNKVCLLDQIPDDLTEKYPAIFQDFENDIYNGLKAGHHLLEKYEKLIFVFPGGKEPVGFINGFKAFCQDYAFSYEIFQNLQNKTLNRGEVYILPNDRDLVYAVKKCGEQNFKIGEEVGIISINDTPLKEVVANGITTISTDFKEMGKQLARFIIEQGREQIKNPSGLIIRHSL
ncbi:GntR family transcriptional regulator [Marinilabiliaceae bacterium JC017]|nr:GntR family transcriptional regulator [Marinilabiliaceae bacterium JC017]